MDIRAWRRPERKIAPEKFRNDLVDITFAPYGACFDGPLTNDKLTAELYENAMFFLEKGFLRKELPPRDKGRSDAH